MERRLVTLQVVAQDGMRVRAAAKASSMRRKERLRRLHEIAREQVRALQAELEADAGASSRRKQAAGERAARERAERLQRALNTFNDIEQGARDSAKNKARERALRGSRAGRNKAGEARGGSEDAKTEAEKVEQAGPEQGASEARAPSLWCRLREAARRTSFHWPPRAPTRRCWPAGAR